MYSASIARLALPRLLLQLRNSQSNRELRAWRPTKSPAENRTIRNIQSRLVWTQETHLVTHASAPTLDRRRDFPASSSGTRISPPLNDRRFAKGQSHLASPGTTGQYGFTFAVSARTYHGWGSAGVPGVRSR